MKKEIYDTFVAILKTELVPALGCTEPIALAYAAAKARSVLGTMPRWAHVLCSGNIIKNVKSVKVPNSGGLKGVEAAAALGIVGGREEQQLEVLRDITEEHRRKTKELLEAKFCKCYLLQDSPNLFIEVTVENGDDKATVRIENEHTNITYIEKNGEILFKKTVEKEEETNKFLEKVDKSLLSIERIVEFADTVDIADVKDVLQRQIDYNYAISEEGLRGEWGAQIGKLALSNGDSMKWRAIARACAGSDARMGGCAMPVIINSGSGNQGMTCSLPVIECARCMKKSDEELYRALCVANLAVQEQKRFIGSLSAFCGVTCSAAGAAAGITYLCGGRTKQVGDTIINAICNVGGMVCDGAKASCASKIYTALQSAFLAHEMAMRGIVFEAGDGLVMDNAEETIKAVGYMGRYGMKNTDVEILNLMTGKTKLTNY